MGVQLAILHAFAKARDAHGSLRECASVFCVMRNAQRRSMLANYTHSVICHEYPY
jgi:hypothetical protein